MQSIYIYAIYKMPIFAIPYVRTTFCNPECWKYTFSLCNNDILQYRMLKIYIFLMKYWHFGPANARREDLINAIYIYICNLYIYAIYKMPIFAIPYVRTTFCNPECWKYTFSLCNNDILQYRMLKIYIFLMKYWHFGPANARREAGGRQPGNRADRDPAECKK